MDDDKIATFFHVKLLSLEDFYVYINLQDNFTDVNNQILP